MYECAICNEVNHDNRLHCQRCGTIPAKYSILGCPATALVDDISYRFIPTVAAVGAVRAYQHHASRVNLRTVPLDYYAE